MGKVSSKLGLEHQNSERIYRNQTLNQSSTNKSSSVATKWGDDFSVYEQDLQAWCRMNNKDYPNINLKDLLDDVKLLAPFLTDVFSQEVEASECTKTLFRGNSLANKIMSHCFKIFGTKYLKQQLEPHLEKLLDSERHEAVCRKSSSASGSFTTCSDDDCSPRTLKSSISYEIDSTKLEQDGSIATNQKNVMKLTKEILDSILNSSSEFPLQLNIMCICLRNEIYKKYPNAENSLSAVGTVIFLRFINPAILAPLDAGIVDRQPSKKTQRGLMLASKILQNIANNVEFSKEQHMLPLNDFVREHFEPMKKWVEEISKPIHPNTTPCLGREPPLSKNPMNR